VAAITAESPTCTVLDIPSPEASEAPVRSSSQSFSSAVPPSSFTNDLSVCQRTNTEPEDFWTRCDLTDASSRGIPLLLIGVARAGTPRTWNALTTLASGREGQGHVKALGAKSISEMQGLRAYPDEASHCWIVRVLCRVQHENIDNTAGAPRSAIFGTLWNPYLGALKHK
jgi:hypothetical protein